MLQAIIITRLHAMYQGSRRILIFLIVTFLAINIYNGVGAIMITMYTSGGAFHCELQKNMHLIDEYQRNSSSMALISARLTSRKI